MSRDHEQGGLFDAPQELPQGLVYEPDFLTRDEEQALVAAIAPLPLREAKFREYFAKRRVAHFHEGEETAPTLAAAASSPLAAPRGGAAVPRGGPPGPRPRYDDGDADTFTSGPLPPFLVALRDKVAHRLRMAPASFIHALLSEYRPGTPIGWHRDKPQYGIVVGISLAGVGRMRWRPYAHQDAQHTVSLDLARRSMYVMRGPIRWQWQHSMPPMQELRYSITMRTRSTLAEREF